MERQCWLASLAFASGYKRAGHYFLAEPFAWMHTGHRWWGMELGV